MAYDQATLIQMRDNYVAQKLDLSTKAKPTYNADGQMVDWVAYLKYLDEQIASLNQQIDAFDLGTGIESFQY